MAPPRLIIIAERYTLPDDQTWLKRIQLLSTLLSDYPTIALQIRSKENPVLRAIAARRIPAHPQIFFNASPEEAVQHGWTSIHIPQRHIPAVIAPSLRFGISLHHPCTPHVYAQIKPMYAQFGPIHPPLSKTGKSIGLAVLDTMCHKAPYPIIAVGGMTPHRAKACIEHGAYGIATAGHIMRASQPQKEIEAFLKQIT